MRVAQQEKRGLLLGAAGFESFPVDFIAIVHIQQRAFEHLAATVAYAREETVVHWRQYQHLLSRHRHGLGDTGDCRNDARDVDYVGAVDVPAVTAPEPRNDGFIVAVANEGVAENALCGTLFHGAADSRSCGKVHIGHPNWNEIFSCACCHGCVPFDAACAAAVGRLIELCLH